MTPHDFRASVRQGLFTKQTAGQCDGYVQANLAMLPSKFAEQFHEFCRLNHQACPVLGVSEPGSWELPELGEDIDIRTDVSGYMIYRNGAAAERVPNLLDHWQEDLVVFALGCSYSFDFIMLHAGMSVRHIEQGVGVPAYVTSILNKKVGPFGGNLVVSMRPVKHVEVAKAIELTGRYPKVHGAPVSVESRAASVMLSAQRTILPLAQDCADRPDYPEHFSYCR